MSSMPMMAPGLSALMTVAMMVAMMLPSFGPALWRYHRLERAIGRTTRFAVGYGVVWTAVGLAVFAMNSELHSIGPRVMGAILICAGALQCSQWKANRLLRCRHVHGTVSGWRFGIDCVLSCVAPTAVLVVLGPIDPRAMWLITSAVTAERIAPAGAQIARASGAVALTAGIACLLGAL